MSWGRYILKHRCMKGRHYPNNIVIQGSSKCLGNIHRVLYKVVQSLLRLFMSLLPATNRRYFVHASCIEPSQVSSYSGQQESKPSSMPGMIHLRITHVVQSCQEILQDITVGVLASCVFRIYSSQEVLQDSFVGVPKIRGPCDHGNCPWIRVPISLYIVPV